MISSPSVFPETVIARKRADGRTQALGTVFLVNQQMGVSTWNGQEILDVLDKYDCVKAYFAGHLHEGSYGVRKNVMHVTFKGIVETSPNTYAFVKLSPNSIEVVTRPTL